MRIYIGMIVGYILGSYGTYATLKTEYINLQQNHNECVLSGYSQGYKNFILNKINK